MIEKNERAGVQSSSGFVRGGGEERGGCVGGSYPVTGRTHSSKGAFVRTTGVCDVWRVEMQWCWREGHCS